MTSVIPYPAPADDPDDFRPSKLRAHLERQALPSPARVVQHARWWGTEGAKGAGIQFLKLPWLAVKEMRPIGIGLGKIVSGLAHWMAVAEYAEATRVAEGNDRAKHQERVEKRRAGRRVTSLVLVLGLSGLGWWAAVTHPVYLVAAGIVLACVCDWAGKRGQETTKALPPPMRTVLKEGVPLSQITAAVVDTLLREGIEVGISRELRYDADRREYRMQLSSLDEIKAEHLRAIERGIGASDHTIRNLATGTATVRELVIRDGDALAVFADRPFIPTGSRSVAQPHPLGVSMTEVPFELPFAGVHMRIIMASGGGKTKWFLRACIDAVSADFDAVIWGADLTDGPEWALWRGVIQKRGMTPEKADELLDAAIVEIERRGKILTAIAEDDDPDNDVDEWHSGLGPALIIFFDEFSQAAAFDGKGGKLNLLGKCEQIVRTGRKHWVSMVMLTQRTGNDDFGSTTMSSQCAVTIAGACDPADTVRMFGVERRDMGYAPHLLSPGVEGDPRDAGKVFINSPMHKTPDMYRAFAPGANSEVKRRARQRIADGLPSLCGSGYDGVQDVAEVPPVLVAVEKAFGDAGNPEWMATVDLLPLVQAMGFPELTANALSSGIPVDKNEPGSRQRRPGEQNPRQGYLLTSIRRAMEAL